MGTSNVSQPKSNGKGVSIKKQGHTTNGQFGSDYSRKANINPAKEISPKA